MHEVGCSSAVGMPKAPLQPVRGAGRGHGSGPGLSLNAGETRPAPVPHIHLDLYAADRDSEVERLLALGARRVEHWPYPDEPYDFVVLEDPDGNRFCVIDASQD